MTTESNVDTDPTACQCICHDTQRALMHMFPCCYRCPSCGKRVAGDKLDVHVRVFCKGVERDERTKILHEILEAMYAPEASEAYSGEHAVVDALVKVANRYGFAEIEKRCDELHDELQYANCDD